MVTIEPLKETDIEAVRKVSLGEEQIQFAGTAEQFLTSASETAHLHVIKVDHVVVGFFKLDTAYSTSYDFCPEAGIGLRGFAIDSSQQGKGIGTRAVLALFSYLEKNYSDYKFIYLTVNCKNPGARVCYQKGGFENTNEKYLGGAAGPQYIMYGNIS